MFYCGVVEVEHNGNCLTVDTVSNGENNSV